MVEGYGLLRQRRWAEWLTIIAGLGLVPLEVWELFRHPSLTLGGVLVGNLLIVAFMYHRLREKTSGEAAALKPTRRSLPTYPPDSDRQTHRAGARKNRARRTTEAVDPAGPRRDAFPRISGCRRNRRPARLVSRLAATRSGTPQSGARTRSHGPATPSDVRSRAPVRRAPLRGVPLRVAANR